MDTLSRFKKPLLIIAIILVAVELVWAGYTLTRPIVKNSTQQVTVPTTSQQSSSVPVAGASASVVFQGPTSVKLGDTFKVDINLSTNAPTIGADLVFKYDPKVLEIVSPDKTAAVVGKIYKDYPSNSFDALGVVTISGVSPDKGFTGEGIFATITFKAKANGTTKLSLDFKEGSTTDSNVTETSDGSDILKSVNNLEITIN